MNNSSTTLKDVMMKSNDVSEGLNGSQWHTLSAKINKEIKGIKWTLSQPDLTQKVGELLDIKIPEILISSWKKELAFQKTIKESIASPEETFYIELAEHTVKSEHQPYIEVSVKGLPPKKIKFILSVLCNLKGFTLKIKNGEIREIQTGICEIESSFKYEDLTLAKKNLSPLMLPGSIQLH